MKKLLGLVLSIAILATMFAAITITSNASAASTNLLVGDKSTFESATVPTGWGVIAGPAAAISTVKAHGGTNSILQTGRTFAYMSPSYNIYDLLKANGAGVYEVSMWVYADGLAATTSSQIMIRASSALQYSFLDAGQTYTYFGISSVVNQTWTQLKGLLIVSAADLANASGNMSLCCDGINASSLYFDDVSVSYYAASAVVPVGTYGYGFSYSPSFTATGAWQRVDSLGTDVLNTTTGISNVVIKNTSSAAFSVYLESLNATWSVASSLVCATVSIPAGAIRTLTVTGIPITNTVLLLRFTGLTASSTFIIGNITNVTKASSLASNNGDIPDTTVSLVTLDAGDNYTPGATPIPGATVAPTVGPDGNIFFAGDIEGATPLAGWTEVAPATMTLDTAIKHSGSNSIKETGRTGTWYSPAYNIFDMIKANGAGNYTLKMWVYPKDTDVAAAQIIIRGDADVTKKASFMSVLNGQAYISGPAVKAPMNTWTQLTFDITVTAEDVAATTNKYNFCVDGIATGIDIYVDDFMVIDKAKVGAGTVTAAPVQAYKYKVDGTNDLASNGTFNIYLNSVTGLYNAATDTATLYVMNTSSKSLTFNLCIGWYWSHTGDNKTSAIGSDVVVPAGGVAKLTVTGVKNYFEATATDPFYDSTKPLGATSVVRLNVTGIAKDDTFILAGPTAIGIWKGLGYATDVSANVTTMVAPAALSNLVNGVKGTGDSMLLGYAIVAIIGIGTLVTARRRLRKQTL